MSDIGLTAHIHELIDEKLASNVVVTVNWVTRCVLEERSDMHGADADFYRDCASRDIARVVRAALGKYDAEDITPRDLLLPGFEHLCRAYSMTRGAEPVLVPVAMCTDAELEGRADQLEKQALGCRAHASELRMFIEERAALAAA